jgi:hypothetical protein
LATTSALTATRGKFKLFHENDSLERGKKHAWDAQVPVTDADETLWTIARMTE